MLTLFHSPGACSIGIVFLLEELGAEYRLADFSLSKGDQHDTAFRKLDPKGKVPTLVLDDGAVLTEFPAIAYWLIRKHGAPALWPETVEAQARILELVDFIVSSIHMRGFTFITVPQKFTADPAAQAELRTLGRREVETGLATVAERIGPPPGPDDPIGMQDAALFYVLVWARAFKIALPDPLSAYADALLSRPSARIAMAGIPAG